jgi:hypothetical protein
MGFEAQPPIADLEIAATWDEIELEAVLKGRSAVPEAPEALEPLAQGPVAEPVLAAAVQPFAIPKFLTTECPSLEPGHSDRLIPLPTAVATCALVGAVLLIYFGSSQEFGVAAHPIVGASELMETRAAPPEVPPSVAVRQAFVAEPIRRRPSRWVPIARPFVEFDFLEDVVPPPSPAKAEPAQ